MRHSGTRRLEEAHDEFRESAAHGGVHDVMPVCFVHEISFKDLGIPWHRDKVTAVIQEERDCQSFTVWKQGFDPKEHYQMRDTKLMLDWQEQQAQLDRDWRDNQAREERDWRAEESRL